MAVVLVQGHLFKQQVEQFQKVVIIEFIRGAQFRTLIHVHIIHSKTGGGSGSSRLDCNRKVVQEVELIPGGGAGGAGGGGLENFR